MITADFLTDGGKPAGFSIKGHACYGDEGEDIVCAAVSSAVQLAANLITEGFGVDASVTAVGDCVNLMLTGSESSEAAVVIEQLRSHLAFISEDYPGTIIMTSSEV